MKLNSRLIKLFPFIFLLIFIPASNAQSFDTLIIVNDGGISTVDASIARSVFPDDVGPAMTTSLGFSAIQYPFNSAVDVRVLNRTHQ